MHHLEKEGTAYYAGPFENSNGRAQLIDETIIAIPPHYVAEIQRIWGIYVQPVTYACGSQVYCCTNFTPFSLLLSGHPWSDDIWCNKCRLMSQRLRFYMYYQHNWLTAYPERDKRPTTKWKTASHHYIGEHDNNIRNPSHPVCPGQSMNIDHPSKSTFFAEWLATDLYNTFMAPKFAHSELCKFVK